MPDYPYKCDECGHEWEISCSIPEYRKIRDDVICPIKECHSDNVYRVLTPIRHKSDLNWELQVERDFQRRDKLKDEAYNADIHSNKSFRKI